MSQPVAFVTLAAALCLLASSTCLADEAAGQARKVSPWFIYQGEGSIDLLRPHAQYLSSISVCGGCPKPFVDQCHELGIGVYLLIGIEGKDGAQFSTPDKRQELIAYYLQRCRDTGCDGIDLDYESLDRACRDNYSALLREVSTAFHNEGLKVSTCVSYIMSTWRTGESPEHGAGEIDGGWYDPAVIGETCDLVRVMCYDMHSTSGLSLGPVSTAPWARDAMRFWMQHVSAERLVMGLPAYSRDFAMKAFPEPDSLYAPAPVLPEGTQVRRIWLPYQGIYQYQYADANGVPHIFLASDGASTRAHLSNAAELGLPTVGFWHFGAVTEEAWAAVREWVGGG